MRLSINTGTLLNKLYTAKQSSEKAPYSLNHAVRKRGQNVSAVL